MNPFDSPEDTELEDSFVDSDNIQKQFEENAQQLADDIVDLDKTISNVKKHIFTIESSMSSIESSIQNNKSLTPADKSKLFQVLNKLAETLNLYYSSLQRFMDLKYKYRTEENGLKFKISRLIHVELKDLNKKNTMTNTELLELMKKYQHDTGNINQDISIINDDPLYKF